MALTTCQACNAHIDTNAGQCRHQGSQRYYIGRAQQRAAKRANLWEVLDDATLNIFNAPRVVSPPVSFDEAERLAADFNASKHLAAVA